MKKKSSCRVHLAKVANGLLYGTLWFSGHHSGRLVLFVGEHLHSAIPVRECASVSGTPDVTPARQRFVFPLPKLVERGGVHRLSVRFEDHDGVLVVGGEGTLLYRSGEQHGRVSLKDGAYAGWVGFSQRPLAMPDLRVTDLDGNLRKLVPLLPLLAENGVPEKYVANFHFPESELAAPLRFFCGNVELKGSPLRQAAKLIGLLEKCSGRRLEGWAFDYNQPTAPVELVLKVDGIPVSRFRPNLRRPDIAKQVSLDEDALGIVGFRLEIPEALRDGKAHKVAVEFFGQAHPLRGSGQVVTIPPVWEEFQPRPAALRRQVLPALSKVRVNRPLVSVIILNRDGASLLDALFSSWKKYNSVADVEFIVVDHASIDGSLELLKKWQRILSIRIIALDYNDSFSASSNRAAAVSRGRYLLFMNNDIVWLQDALPGMLDSLVTDDGVAAVGLKLLKSTDEGLLLEQTQVQHLGVRFKLSGAAYWPYEVTPKETEAEYSPQFVPVVTAAVMLCRKQDFKKAGQFDPAYFYGFEDVELCMRMGQRLGKRIVCRNDLVALHRHGHTRLSGRAADIYQRVVNNADIMQAKLGLWLKQAFWRSLVNADKDLTVEPLTIGLVVDERNPEGGASTFRKRVEIHADRIAKAYPSARIVMLSPGLGWYAARQIHILLVGHPDYDIRNICERREDLLVLAWLNGRAESWLQVPWLSQFDAYLSVNKQLSEQLAPVIGSPILQTDTDPLGAYLENGPPLRVALLRNIASEEAGRRADVLERALKAAGAIVWRETYENLLRYSRLVDVRIFVDSTETTIENENIKAEVDSLNVIWSVRPEIQDIEGWVRTVRMPSANWLKKKLDKALGNTFRTP